MDHMMCDLTLCSAVNNHGVSMAMMPRRIARVLIAGEIIDRAEHVLLIGRILVSIKMPLRPFDLAHPPRAIPLLTAEPYRLPAWRKRVLAIADVAA